MRYLICALVLTASGCVTSKSVMLPNGTQGIAIRCNGAAHDISDCMNAAARVCGGPYRVISGDQSDVGGAMVPAGNGAVFVRGIHRSMIVKCGAP